MRARPQDYKVELSQLKENSSSGEPTAYSRPRAKGRFGALGIGHALLTCPKHVYDE